MINGRLLSLYSIILIISVSQFAFQSVLVRRLLRVCCRCKLVHSFKSVCVVFHIGALINCLHNYTDRYFMVLDFCIVHSRCKIDC